jgi:hypothetical protein
MHARHHATPPQRHRCWKPAADALTVASIEMEKLRVTEASVELRWVKTHPMDRFD